jgi:hypothetical protein
MLDGFQLRLRGAQLVVRVDAPDNQHTPIHFNFADDFGNEFAIAGVNLARFQRTAKSAGQSAAGSGHNIIQRGCARREFARRDLVMLSYFRVHAKMHGFLLCWQVSQPQRSDLALDPHPGRVDNIIVFRHGNSLAKQIFEPYRLISLFVAVLDDDRRVE